MTDILKECKIVLKGKWNEKQRQIAEQVFEDMTEIMGVSTTQSIFSGTRILFIASEQLGKMGFRSFAPPPPLSTILGADVVLINPQPEYTIAHELGHVWDYRTKYNMSHELMVELGTWKQNPQSGKYEWQPYPCPEPYPGTPDVAGDDDPQTKGLDRPYAATRGGGGGLNFIATMLTKPGMEDWAETFASSIYPKHYPKYNRRPVQPDGIRERYLRKRMKRGGRKTHSG